MARRLNSVTQWTMHSLSYRCSIAGRLADVEALASMVVGSLCPQLLLESRPDQVHASGMRANIAFVVVVEV